jgi:hypothetical protein
VWLLENPCPCGFRARIVPVHVVHDKRQGLGSLAELSW